MYKINVGMLLYMYFYETFIDLFYFIYYIYLKDNFQCSKKYISKSNRKFLHF